MDKKAKDILFKTFWKNGWIDDKDIHTAPEDLEYAKSKGLMFDPLTITHDECLAKIITIVEQLPLEKVAKAFLSSLSTKRLDWRSGLASYVLAKQMIAHKYSKAISGESYDENGKVTHQTYTCGICRDTQYGIIGSENYKNIDLNVLNFERLKWGGVRHGNLDYTLFDLEQFVKEVISEPTVEDISTFKAILTTIEASKPEDYPSALEKNLAKTIKSSKNERQIMMEILASIGVLAPGSYDRPNKGKSDWVYVTYWRGEDQYNKKAVNQYFGAYL